jgi:hypothetical protein
MSWKLILKCAALDFIAIAVSGLLLKVFLWGQSLTDWAREGIPLAGVAAIVAGIGTTFLLRKRKSDIISPTSKAAGMTPHVHDTLNGDRRDAVEKPTKTDPVPQADDVPQERPVPDTPTYKTADMMRQSHVPPVPTTDHEASLEACVRCGRAYRIRKEAQEPFICVKCRSVIESQARISSQQPTPAILEEASPQLKDEVYRLFYFERAVVARHVGHAKDKYPGHSERWYWEKVRYDIKRERGLIEADEEGR